MVAVQDRQPRDPAGPAAEPGERSAPEVIPARRFPIPAGRFAIPTGSFGRRHYRGRVILALIAVGIMITTGIAWSTVDNVQSDLATAAGLGLGATADGAIDILMVGIDSRTDAHGNPLSDQERAMLFAGDEVSTSTDTIILVRIPEDGSSATAVSIPRDSYISIPGHGKAKINSVYGTVHEETRTKLVEAGTDDADAEKRATEAGREALVDAVENLSGISVDRYAEIGLLGFVLLTDAVGGVDVCLNAAVDDPYSGANFPAGPQRLNGAQALSFVRQRHGLPRGDLDRIVRQQAFMASLAGAVISSRTLTDPAALGRISQAVERSVVLDAKWDVLDFASRLQDLAAGNVRFETIPVVDLNGLTDAGESVVDVDQGDVRDFFENLVNQEDPTTSEAGDGIDLKVDVANDSGVEGLAATVSRALTGLGYGAGTIANNGGEPVSETTIRTNSDDRGAANELARALGGAVVEQDDSQSAGTVQVILAGDYSGPGVGVVSTEAAAPDESLAPAESTSSEPEPIGTTVVAATDGPPCVS